MHLYLSIYFQFYIVNKADGLLLESARHTVADYQSGMSFIRRKYQQWLPPVISISAYKQINIDKVLQTISLFYTTLNNNNYNNHDSPHHHQHNHHDHHDNNNNNDNHYTNEIERKRQRQWKHILFSTFRRNLIFEIENNKDIKQYLNSYMDDMINTSTTYTTTNNNDVHSNNNYNSINDDSNNDVDVDDNTFNSTSTTEDDVDHNDIYNNEIIRYHNSRYRNYKRRISPRAAADNIVTYIMNKLEQNKSE